MAFTLELNSNHDLSITNRGKFRWVYGPDEVRQRVYVALQHNWQEYFLNVDAGVPWNEVILGSRDLSLVEHIIRRIILDVPGVISIANMEIVWSSTVVRRIEMFVVLEVEPYLGEINPEAIAIEVTAVSNEFANEHVPFAQVNWLFAKG